MMKTKTTKKKAVKKKSKKIGATTKLSKVMEVNPKAGEILFGAGMHCVGCAMAGDESLEEGCMAHGMNKKEIGELLKKLNK